MNKIIEQARHDLKWSRVWPEDDALERQSHRVLLLDKAYRYQKVAKILAHCERMFEARGDKKRRQRCTYKGAVYSLKARKLYQQATEI